MNHAHIHIAPKGEKQQKLSDGVNITFDKFSDIEVVAELSYKFAMDGTGLYQDDNPWIQSMDFVPALARAHS